MSAKTRFRDAASIHVDVSPERVLDLMGNADLLRALDDRLADRDIEIEKGSSHVDVRDTEGRVHVGFRFEPEGDGTRIAAAEDVRPDNPLETTKRMLFPGQSHEDFERELQRLRNLLEALDPGDA